MNEVGLAAEPGCHRAGIDVHSHIVPTELPRYIGARVPASWPSMVVADACHRHVQIDGAIYRTVSDHCWNVSTRLRDMTAQRIAVQAISPMPELLSYWLPTADAALLLRYINDQIGEMVALSAGRMVGLGAVPLQDVDLAVAELTRLMDTPGFAGVEVGSNVNGTPIGAPVFDPFFEAAQALGAAIFVHAIRPAGKERLLGPKQLTQALGYPGEVGLAAASVICGNVMLRYPKLRIAFSHGGGTLASLLPRLAQARDVFREISDTLAEPVQAQARRLFYDALVFDQTTLVHLIAMLGDTQLMLGSDYPFAFRDKNPVDRVEAAPLDEMVKERLIYRNAEVFLGLRARSDS